MLFVKQLVVGHAKLVFTLKCSGAEKCFRCGFKMTEMYLGTLTIERILLKHHSCVVLFVWCFTFTWYSFKDLVCNEYYMKLKHLSSYIISVPCFFCFVCKVLNSFLCVWKPLGFL